MGGGLIEITAITNNTYGLNINLNSTGDFNIQYDGTTITQFRDDGVLFHGDDMYWKDASTTGTDLMTLTDDGNDGRLRIFENGIVSVDLDANTQFVFNEQGLDRDFRVESSTNTDALRIDEGTGNVGIGTSLPQGALHVSNTMLGDATGIKLTQDGSNYLIYHSDIDGDLIIRKLNQTDQLVLDAGGSVGISTSTPSAKLDVNGNVKLGSGGTVLTEVIKATVNHDLPAISSGSKLDVNFTVTGAETGSSVMVSSAVDYPGFILIGNARVIASDMVKVTFFNVGTASNDAAAMDYHITVVK